MIRPRALVRGDRVALVAPASRYDADALARGAAILESWGLVVEVPEPASPLRYLAASDSERAASLTAAFARQDIAAVIAARGGYGTARLLGRFDPAVAATHPRIFVGYSDMTLLLWRLRAEAGLVCFHGPMAASDLPRLEPEQLERFRRFLFGEDGWWAGSGLECRAPGSATGRLVGGCLSVIATTIGTPYEIDTRGGVLFLEDIGEKPYRIDRLLTHLAHAGKFDDVAAVVLGAFHDCDLPDAPGEVMAIADEILGSLGIPVVSGFDAGHRSGGAVLPIGCKVRVVAEAGEIELLEPVFAERGRSRAYVAGPGSPGGFRGPPRAGRRQAMSADAWQEVVSVLDDAVGPARVSPAACVLVGRGGQVVFEYAAGVAGPPGRERPCDFETIFDVASLTKPLVTAALTLDLIARGPLFFDTRVADILPAFAGCADERRLAVSVRHLLRHDAGLPAYRRYFERFDNCAPATTAEASVRRERMFALAVGEALERDPRAGSVYSDVGFLVLGALVEAAAGARIDTLAAERLFGPLGVEDAFFIDTVTGLAPGLVERCAATGPCAWRRRDIHAEVQDENTFAMGGIATHAGLFATARGVHRLVAEWVDASAGRGLVLDRRIVGHAWNRSAAAAGAAPSTWALGWDTPTPGASSAGSRIGSNAVGHLGYTGTSVWVDPSRRVHVVLLTNRIAYGRNQDAIRAFRPRLHDAVFNALDRARH